MCPFWTELNVVVRRRLAPDRLREGEDDSELEDELVVSLRDSVVCCSEEVSRVVKFSSDV